MSAHQQNDLSGSFYERLQEWRIQTAKVLIAIIFIISEIISTGVFDILLQVN